MWWFIWGMVLPACLTTGYALTRRWARRAAGAIRIEKARDQFRLEREGLEARFLAALARIDPVERERWEDAHWHDEVVWARDRQTRRLLVLVGVHFEPEPFDPFPDTHPPRHATVVFEYDAGRWRADGKRLDAIHPHEAFLRSHRYEPVVAPPQRRH